MEDRNFSRSALTKVIDNPNSTTEKLKFSHLEVLEELGRGAVGVVYKVLQTNLNRIIAIKVMEKSCLSNEDIVRFRTEGKTSAKLTHPNIIHVLDFQETESAYFLYMEYIDGTTLDLYWKQNAIGWLELADLIMQLCRAIEHAHSRGIIHRDLKPSNIMMEKKGRPYIMDFGLAKIMGSQNRLTKMGAIMGTPEYMSPEQAQGGDTDDRADIYSLGAIFYEGLCGKPCFEANTSLALIMKIVREQPITPQDINPDIPLKLQEICLKALCKNRDDRYQTAGEMAQELQHYIEDTTEYNKPINTTEEEPQLNASQLNKSYLRSSQISATKKRRRPKTKRYPRMRKTTTATPHEEDNFKASTHQENPTDFSQSQVIPKEMKKIKTAVSRRSRQSKKRASQQWLQVISIVIIILIILVIMMSSR